MRDIEPFHDKTIANMVYTTVVNSPSGCCFLVRYLIRRVLMDAIRSACLSANSEGNALPHTTLEALCHFDVCPGFLAILAYILHNYRTRKPWDEHCATSLANIRLHRR